MTEWDDEPTALELARIVARDIERKVRESDMTCREFVRSGLESDFLALENLLNRIKGEQK